MHAYIANQPPEVDENDAIEVALYFLLERFLNDGSPLKPKLVGGFVPVFSGLMFLVFLECT